MKHSILLLIALGIFSIAALGYFALPSAQSAPAAKSSLPEVRIIRPEVGAGSGKLSLPARAEPYEEAALFARASGFVAEKRADLGSRVAAGQVLAVIDTPELNADARGARAQLERAKAAAELAHLNLKRAESLIKRGFVSRAMLDERRATADTADADVNIARAAIARVDDLLRYRQVRAPFSGQVTERNVERGDRVDGSTGAVPLFRLARLDRLRIVVDLPQGAQAIPVGTSAEISFPEQPGQRYPARVARMSGVYQQTTGAMRLELDMDNPGGNLPAGIVGTAEFDTTAAQSTLLLPNAALVVSKGATRVAILDGEDRLRFRTVTPGANRGGQTEVNGLSPNERVVLNVNALLKEGTKVRPLPLSQQTNQTP
jgi:RND family efflux transporter MFP subunit